MVFFITLWNKWYFSSHYEINGVAWLKTVEKCSFVLNKNLYFNSIWTFYMAGQPAAASAQESAWGHPLGIGGAGQWTCPSPQWTGQKATHSPILASMQVSMAGHPFMAGAPGHDISLGPHGQLVGQIMPKYSQNNYVFLTHKICHFYVVEKGNYINYVKDPICVQKVDFFLSSVKINPP